VVEWACAVHLRQQLELCALFNIPTLLVLADFTGPVDRTGLNERLCRSPSGQEAAPYGVRLGLEFRGRSSFCSSLTRPSRWSRSAVRRTSEFA